MNRSIEEAASAVNDALAMIVPQDASLWAVVQYCREAIREKRALGASWAQIAAAFREAGYPQATESNVRLAFQAAEPLKKVAKARRRRVAKQQSATTSAPPTQASDAPNTGSKVLGAAPRILKDRYSGR